VEPARRRAATSGRDPVPKYADFRIDATLEQAVGGRELCEPYKVGGSGRFKIMAAYRCGTAANYDFAKLSSFRPKQLGEAIAT
jgi:hypothetical protein